MCVCDVMAIAVKNERIKLKGMQFNVLHAIISKLFREEIGLILNYAPAILNVIYKKGKRNILEVSPIHFKTSDALLFTQGVAIILQQHVEFKTLILNICVCVF